MGTKEEEAMDCSTTNKDANGAFDYEFAAVTVAVTKGKRTRRRRIHPPPTTQAPTAAVEPDSSSSSDSSAAAAVATGEEKPAVVVTAAKSVMTEEEEDELDTANCLILLARGRAEPDLSLARCDVYKCRTCDKCFPSFQALGGHRASHKKLKPSPPLAPDEDILRISLDSSSSKPTTAAEINNNNNNSRVHECAICGSEFNSGQALGGHMRRHRPLGVVPAAAGSAAPAEEDKNKMRILLSLDLNLPAPADDNDDHGSEDLQRPLQPSFGLPNNPPPMIFSSSLVGCHY